MGMANEKNYKFCMECGAKLPIRAKYCFSCGESQADSKNGKSCSKDNHQTVVSEKKRARLSYRKNLRGVKGWLLVFVISLSLGAIRLFCAIRFWGPGDCVSMRNNNEACSNLTTYFNLNGSFLLLFGLLLLASAYFIIRHFKAGKIVSIITLIAYFLFSLIEMIWLTRLRASYDLYSIPINAIYMEFVGICEYVLFWIIYLIRSERVKNTLVD